MRKNNMKKTAYDRAVDIGARLDTFTRSCIHTALEDLYHSERENARQEGRKEPRGMFTFDLLTAKTLKDMIADCARFEKLVAKGGSGLTAVFERQPSLAGYHFWMQRSGSGVGFTDGEWPEPEASWLAEIAHSFGECSLYVSRGKIHGYEMGRR